MYVLEYRYSSTPIYVCSQSTRVWRLTWAPRWYRITFTSTHHPRFPQLSCWRDYGRLNGPLQVPVVLSLIIIVLGEQHRFRPNGTGTAANDERWPALVKTTAASGDHSQHSTTLPPTPRSHHTPGRSWARRAALVAGRCRLCQPGRRTLRRARTPVQ